MDAAFDMEYTVIVDIVVGVEGDVDIGLGANANANIGESTRNRIREITFSSDVYQHYHFVSARRIEKELET